MSRQLPALVVKLAFAHNAWIVGSAADLGCDLEKVRDFDVMVPYRYWAEAAQIIPTDARVNSLGGWKCVSEGREVDVWPGDLDQLILSQQVKRAWHPYSGVVIARAGLVTSPHT